MRGGALDQRALILGIGLILITNVVALGGVAWNRSGEPEATLTLTERELRVPYDWGRDRDNSGLSLTLDWRAIGLDPRDARGQAVPRGTWSEPFLSMSRMPAWLDSAKLASLGFSMSHPPNTRDGRTYYQKQVPKRVLLVLELNGPAYEIARSRMREWMAHEDSLMRANPTAQEFIRRAEFANTEQEREEREGSRLFMVDAGLDGGALRSRYPDRTRYAIVRGAVKPQVDGPDSIASLQGQVMELAVERIHVPRRFRAVFDSVRNTRAPRGEFNTTPFSAVIAYGRRLEPWLTSAERRP
jgi:hypothetical protein